jgi:hypothetical protein
LAGDKRPPNGYLKAVIPRDRLLPSVGVCGGEPEPLPRGDSADASYAADDPTVRHPGPICARVRYVSPCH